MIRLDKLDYNKILGIDYFYIKEISRIKQILIIIKAIIGNSFRKYTQISLPNNVIETDFLFIKTQDRKDYNNLYNIIYSQCYHNKYDLKLSYSFSINLYFVTSIFKKANLYVQLNKKYSFLESIYLYIRLIRHMQVLNIIKKVNYKHLVVFSDVQPIENLIVQYSNLNGKNTITLQHALYIDYKEMSNVHMLNYIEVTSKYLLAWGEYTENIFKKYHNNINVIICGKPLEMKDKNFIFNLNSSSNYIGVVLDQPMFRIYNQKLLDVADEIANKKNMKIIVRVHPEDDINLYNINPNLIIDGIEIENSNFIIAHTTSMIYELLRMDCKVYKLLSDVPSNYIHNSLTFANAKELENKLSNNFDFISEGKRHIEYIGEASKKKYKEFFDTINSSIG